MSAPRSLPVGLKPYVGTVVGGRIFGVRRLVNGVYTSPHNGCDFAVPVGIPLESGLDGTVSLVGGSMTHQWGYYLHVMCRCPLQHTQEFHILRDKPTLKVGDPVRVGQIIGHTGRSGSLGGKPYSPHHHNGATVNGKHYNPLTIGWPTAAGGNSAPLDNTEDDMYSDADRKRDQAVYDALFNGGPSMADSGRSVSASLAGIVAVVDAAPAEIADAVWGREVRRGDVKVSALQELADNKTIQIRQEAQIAALTTALASVAGGSVDLVAVRQAAQDGAEAALQTLTLTAKAGE